MAVIPVGFSQVNLRFRGLAQPLGAEVTFGVQNTADLSPLLVGTDVINALTSAGIMANFPSDNQLLEALIKNGPNETGPSTVIGVALPGTGTGATSAPNVTWLANKNTALGGRRGKGRMYWPGVPEGDVTSAGIITSANVTAFASDLTAFLTNLTTAGNKMYLLHGDSPAPLAPTEVLSISLQSRVATQRRRNRR
jgi:hypothetical protein